MDQPIFTIADNRAVNRGRVFVIHLQEPVIIAQAFHFDSDQEEAWMSQKSQFTIGASVDFPGELIFLGAVYCAPLPRKEFQQQADNLAHIMSKMGDWYYQYLIDKDRPC